MPFSLHYVTTAGETLPALDLHDGHRGREAYAAYRSVVDFHQVSDDERDLVSHFCLDCGSIAIHSPETPLEIRNTFADLFLVNCCGPDTTIVVKH
jgi:hypothetical protein